LTLLPAVAAAASSTSSQGSRSVRLASTAASAPALNSSESPGRNGVTTRPVSAKMIRNSSA
jgi:hypothetical protein